MRIIKKILQAEDEPSIRERVAHPLSRLQIQQKKIEQISLQLKRRDQDLFERCREAQRTGDSLRARMYADECAEIRRIARLVLANQFVLEKAIVRLETITQFGDLVGRDLASVASLVREMRSKMSGLIPEVANELQKVNTALVTLTTEIGRAKTLDMNIEISKDETKKVLSEATAMAGQKVKEQYEQLPELESMTSPKQSTSNKIHIKTIPLEMRVYEYASKHTGGFNIAKCALALSVSNDEVERCLDKLVEDGRIALERE